MTTPIHEFPRDWYRATAASFYLRARSQIAPRPWLGGANVYGPHAQMWMSKLTLTPRAGAEGFAVAAFFSRAGGQAGVIRIGDVRRTAPQFDAEAARTVERWSDDTLFDDGSGFESGPLPPNAVLAAAAVKGSNYAVIAGLPASTARVLRRGDLFEIRPNGVAAEFPHLYEVMVDGPTNAAGQTGVEIRPLLRADVAAGDQVVLRYPTSVFRAIDDDQGAGETGLGMITHFGFTLIEAVDLLG